MASAEDIQASANEDRLVERVETLEVTEDDDLQLAKKFDSCKNIVVNYDDLDELKADNIDQDLHQVFMKESSSLVKTHRHQGLAKRVSKIIKNMMANDGGKVADVIKLTNCGPVYVGNKILIIEQIVLKEVKKEKGEVCSYDYLPLKDFTNYFYLMERRSWLARPRVAKPDFVKDPAKYVIIAHTATDQYQTQLENISVMQDVQNFHIDSMGWADIGYNFCIGSDGNAYEGRGWFLLGAHTLGYNSCSVGIAFIGCFLNVLPPKTSLNRCKELIQHGVQIGAISPDYELLAQSQCRPFLSPGPALYQEISTWEHFNPNIKNTDPCLYTS